MNYEDILKELAGGMFYGEQLDTVGMDKLPKNIKTAILAVYYMGLQQGLISAREDEAEFLRGLIRIEK